MCEERVGLILLGSTHVNVIDLEGALYGKNTQITDVTFDELVRKEMRLGAREHISTVVKDNRLINCTDTAKQVWHKWLMI